MSPRDVEHQLFSLFAAHHGLSTAAGGVLPIRGMMEGIDLTIAKAERGQVRYPWPVTQFLAATPVAIPGGLVAYKPNFRWRFQGKRKISDSLGVSGLFGFVHHDPLGDPELDRRLVVYADDVPLARAMLTAPEVKRAILAALATAGHIRIHQSRVALEVSERRGGTLRLLASVEEVEAIARAATGVARALSAAAATLGKA